MSRVETGEYFEEIRKTPITKVVCDGCGAVRDVGAQREGWYALWVPAGGALDYCSVPCLARAVDALPDRWGP